MKAAAEIIVPMTVDADGAPNAYGPDDHQALDCERCAHDRKDPTMIVGYLTRNGNGRTPVVQGPNDPCPGFYVSTTAYYDVRNANPDDPRRYVNAAEINFTLHATVAQRAGVALGDFCVVHSLHTRLTVYAIVGDVGHPSGAEGSLALLQRLGYPFRDGKNDSVEKAEIVVRYFAGTNPGKRFFLTQAELDAAARALDLDTDFSRFHAGDPGKLVMVATAVTGDEPPVERVQPFAPLSEAQAQDVPVYPGHLLTRDSDDFDSVRVLQRRLRDLGYTESCPDGSRPLTVDGGFGTDTLDAVELFQMRHADLQGRPLVVDGQVGASTWAALFGRDAVHVSPATTDDALLAKVLEIAAGEIGVLEDPLGSNSGPRVDEYLAAVGAEPGSCWCAAFTYWCFCGAAKALGVKNPAIRTAGVLDHWNQARGQAGVATVTMEQALDDPSLIQPGFVFIMSTGGGNGHTGLVVRVSGGALETIEGNTNGGGSRNGIGVFRRTGRTVADITRGYIHYGGKP